ncbi:MAG TPA: hypothetical protein VFH33_01015, partial [Candidatus Krumholzibacteria bacterium]|nr:hypothetical protein [Candidatus Krumholzibacteria bacterium]
MSPGRRRLFKVYVAWLFYGYASVLHMPQTQSEPPAPMEQSIQLGDSVGMPTRTIDMSHQSTVAFFLQEKDLLPESVAF